MLLLELLVVSEKKGVIVDVPLTALVARTELKLDSLSDLNSASINTLNALDLGPASSEDFVANQHPQIFLNSPCSLCYVGHQIKILGTQLATLAVFEVSSHRSPVDIVNVPVFSQFKEKINFLLGKVN